MTSATTLDLDRRVQRLETSNRRWRVAALALMALVTVAWSAPRQAAEQIETQALTLVDGEGNVLAELKAAEGGPALLLYDAAGIVRASLAHNDEATALYLRDAAGDTRVGTAQYAHGGGGRRRVGPGAAG